MPQFEKLPKSIQSTCQVQKIIFVFDRLHKLSSTRLTHTLPAQLSASSVLKKTFNFRPAAARQSYSIFFFIVLFKNTFLLARKNQSRLSVWPLTYCRPGASCYISYSPLICWFLSSDNENLNSVPSQFGNQSLFCSFCVCVFYSMWALMKGLLFWIFTLEKKVDGAFHLWGNWSASNRFQMNFECNFKCTVFFEKNTCTSFHCS